MLCVLLFRQLEAVAEPALSLQIVQLTQSGSALICVILHTQGTNKPLDQQLFIVALEGLSACIAVLRHLGERVRSLSSPFGTRH